MKICPTCQTQWEDFVELCFKDGTPLQSLVAQPPRAEGTPTARIPLLPDPPALPPVPEVTDETERPTMVAPAVAGGAQLAKELEVSAPLPPPPTPRFSDLDDVPAPPPASPPSQDATEEDTVLSVEAMGRTSALPAVDEHTNTSEIDFQIPQNLGPVSAGQTILPMDDEPYRLMVEQGREAPNPTLAPTSSPVGINSPPVTEKVPVEKAKEPEKMATPVHRAPPKVVSTPASRPAPVPVGGASIGVAVMGLTALAVVLVGLAGIWFWHSQTPAEGKIVVPPSPSVPASTPPPAEAAAAVPAPPAENPGAANTAPPAENPAVVPTAPSENPVPPPAENPVAPPVAPATPTEAAKTGVIRLNGLPSGATVLVDGKAWSATTRYPYGAHEVKVEVSGYVPTKLLINLNSPEAVGSPKLVPAGKMVTVDLACTGQAPCTVVLDTGASVNLPGSTELAEGLHSFRVGSCSVYRAVKMPEGGGNQSIVLPCTP